jgi:hypothetical protein
MGWCCYNGALVIITIDSSMATKYNGTNIIGSILKLEALA